ncbi:hypothetical protein [Streptomyces pini]|uniref:Uncharacterized protein n=1 Tax=Streptomyces pini TaxID=1520580 RepID=A0A1I3X4Y9_9ACTN|nr:hypothetical protein [Streptomyces pini]SFK14902.1 hypothetical protein SAMN05192584_10443 [Streptomyces pini]
MVLTPVGRLIRRSAGPADRTELFAAQFSLTHGCRLLTYPLAEWPATAAGLQSAVLVLGAVACAFGVLAMRVWPADDTGLGDGDRARGAGEDL